jgi:hypothetical protein
LSAHFPELILPSDARYSDRPAFRHLGARVLFAALALLAWAAPARAQTYEFVGTIVDDIRGEPVGGVEIFTPDGRKLGTSQPSGRFEVTVNNRGATVVFKREGFRDQEENLGELARIIDVDIVMESSVRELDEVTAYTVRKALDPSQAQSIEELESLQGMRMDLNDHLRQMHGVAGMNEFTGDISVHGSRTQDVTHYLGRSRVPSLRHLEFGFPGNQSVLNPRLLKSVTLADNPAKGPLNQGNASALVYDLQEGDPEAIRGDIVLGSVNRELNLSSYWGKRTNLFSARYLDPNGLGALGRQFFATPKDSRINCKKAAEDGTPCVELDDPLRFSSLDVFFSTFKRDTTGAFSRHTLIVLDDKYEVLEDKALLPRERDPQVLVEGFQGAWLYSYESIRPTANGELEWGFSWLRRDYEDGFRDTIPNTQQTSDNYRPWFPVSGAGTVENIIGEGSREDRQFILSLQWSSASHVFGATPSYGLEMEYTQQSRRFRNIALSTDPNHSSAPASQFLELPHDLVLGNALYRLRWNLSAARVLEASLGAALAYEGWRQGAQTGSLPPAPLASARYTHPLGKEHSVFVEGALRQSVVIEPADHAPLVYEDALAAHATPSLEAKLGGNGFLLNPLRYAWSGYARVYKDPALPSPEVYWNYDEIRSSDRALVKGGNLTLNYLPGHHAGAGINASVIQGAYHMRDGGSLPWESNRTLDFVANLRFLPRDDSLLSFIVTYGVQNGAPLYEHDSLWIWTNQVTNEGYSTGERYVRQNSGNPSVSRQRLDARVNIDLKSKWRPLESMRFFFEATNIFANFGDGPGAYLGGNNERRRGWTRADDSGDLEPVVTRGLGLFLMFGIEGKLKI